MMTLRNAPSRSQGKSPKAELRLGLEGCRFLESGHAGADMDVQAGSVLVGVQAARFFASRALMLSTSALGVAANSVFV